MKKNIWIWNHYATDMYWDQGGRHYWFAKYLRENGYKATVFAANTKHNSDVIIDTEGKKYITKETNGIPFVFVKTSPYKGNGISRVRNMLWFAINLYSMSKRYASENGMPDAILASSVHPLTLMAGICAAKRLKVPCICEVRDLWPETLVAYGSINKNSLIAKALYAGEKWIYKKADKLIFTMEGGKDYIIEKGWDKDSGGPIELSKVFHINNGVDLKAFDYYKEYYQIEDEDLKDDTIFKVIYTGSIRMVNRVGILLDAARVLLDRGEIEIKFLIWGEGNELESLKRRASKENLHNVVFKGRVDKKYIPHILTQGQLNIIPGENNTLYKYGLSPNKLFEYFASEKPVLMNARRGFDLLKEYRCGITVDDDSAEALVDAIINLNYLSKSEYDCYCRNARKAAEDYNFAEITKRLIGIVEIG